MHMIKLEPEFISGSGFLFRLECWVFDHHGPNDSGDEIAQLVGATLQYKKEQILSIIKTNFSTQSLLEVIHPALVG